MPKYRSNLNIFFNGGYLEDNIVPLITEIPKDMSIDHVDAWEVLFEDIPNKVGFFKSFDPETDFYLLLQDGKEGIIFFGDRWKSDCVDYMQANNLVDLINLLGRNDD